MGATEGDIGGLGGVQAQMLIRSVRVAMKSGRYQKAEAACNKVLALDSSNVETLLAKAEAITRQSRPDNDRTIEVIECCSLAIDSARLEDKSAVRRTASQKVKLSLMFHVGFVCKKFVSAGGKTNGDAVRMLPRLMTDHAAEWKDVSGEDILDDVTRKRVSCAMEDAACTTWNKRVLLDYETNGARSKEELDKFVSSGDLCIAIIGNAIAFSPNDPSSNVVRYRHLIGIMSSLVDAHSIRETQGRWVRAYSLSEEDKESRCKRIDSWRNEMSMLDGEPVRGGSIDHRDASQIALRVSGGSVLFFVVTSAALIANALLLLAVVLQLAQWVPSMMQGNLLCALFGVAGVAGGFSFAGCVTDALKQTPSKQTGHYLVLCAIALNALVFMGWEGTALGCSIGFLGMIDVLTSLYYLACGKAVE